MLAAGCIVSVWPVIVTQRIPALQQDWTWPLSRVLAWQWLHAFVGLWDERGFGQGNALPWQTYAVFAQVALIQAFGTATALGIWIAALEFLAGYSCIAMLATFGVRSWAARVTAALFYALGPVSFTRIAAGHLAYVLAYALLPLAVALGRRCLKHSEPKTAIALGIVIGLSGSQIQFLAITWLAVLPLVPLSERTAGWWGRLLAAAGIGVAVQLQALLPMAFGSTGAAYASQPALLSFEYNNSSPFASAPVMLGYFTRYYESHALAGAFWIIYVLLAASVALAIVNDRRAGIFAVTLVVVGTVLTAGLYGPLSPLLGWTFERVAYAAVFRDLHYFAALTAVGIALALGVGLQKLPAFCAIPALALVGWIIAPALMAGELSELLVPPAYVADALADMQTAAANGAGRVLWLPAEEPLGLRDWPHRGRDFTAYGPPRNPSVSDDYQNPQLAYALARLRAGKPDWNAFVTMNVRYLVVRNYVESGRGLNFGTGYPMAFAGLDDAQLARLLARAHPLVLLRRTVLSSVYALDRNRGLTYTARAAVAAVRFSELNASEVAIDAGAPSLHAHASLESADPRGGWVEGTIGWRYAAWLPDSIYPFVWTLSSLPLTLETAGGTTCVLAGATPRGATLRRGEDSINVRAAWSPYPVAGAAPQTTMLPRTGDVSAVSDRACAFRPASVPSSVFVFAGGYDTGWRALDDERLVAPTRANGWMMAWDAALSARPRVYVPALLQLVGVLVLAVVLAVALRRVRRARVSETKIR